MKRQISTILTLTILTTSLPSSTCFANDMPELITVQGSRCEECASGGVPSAAKENHLSKSTTEQTKHNKIWETVSNLHVGDTLRSAIARAKQSKAWKTLSNLSVSDTLKSTAKRAKQSKAWKTLSNLSVNDTLKSVAVQVKQSKALKITAGTTVGASAVAGTAVAGLKIFEDSLPESVKEYLPNWLKKDELDQSSEEKCKAKSYDDMKDEEDIAMPGNITEAEPEISDSDNQEKCPAKCYETMEDVRDAAMPGNITTKTEPEILDSDNQEKCPAKCYKNMEDVRDTEMLGNITNSTSNVNNSGNAPQPKQPQSGENSVKPIMNKNNEEGHKKGTDWNGVAEKFESVASEVITVLMSFTIIVCLINMGARKPHQGHRY